MLLSEGLTQAGRADDAAKVLQTAEAVARATRLDDVFQQTRPRQVLPLPGDSTAGAVIPVK